MMHETLVLLPAYNEGRSIGAVINAVRDAMDGAMLVVVDDGSCDDTAIRAREAGAVVLSLPFNAGYGVALQTGYKYAVAQGAAYVIQLDSDGQHDPASLSTLRDRVRSGEVDLCVGSRFLEGESYPIPWGRRVGMYVLRRVASWLIGQTITDPTSGLQAMNRKVFTFCAGDHYPVDYPDTFSASSYLRALHTPPGLGGKT